MQKIKFMLFLVGVSVLTSCANPFDLKAIEKHLDSVAPISFKAAATNIVSGGSVPVVTSGGYKVTNSIGVLSTLPQVTTGSGYSISSSLNSD